MVTIPIKTHLQPDGTLDLRIPTGLPESDVEVLVVVQPVTKPAARWPEGLIESTYGAFAGHPLEQPSPGECETREDFR
jgi:hypothetical protein